MYAVASWKAMRNRREKIARAAHIRRNTAGTSNEISFSVLDAAKQAQDADRGKGGRIHLPSLGAISLFTLGKGRKPPATPTKERGITLSTGEFVSAETAPDPSSTPQTIPGVDADESRVGLGSKPSNEANSRIVAAQGPSEAAASSAEGKKAAVSTAEGSSSASAAGSRTSARHSSVPWTTPMDQVAQRKGTRLRRKRLAVAAAVLCVAVLVAIAGTTLYSGFEAQRAQRETLAAALEQVNAVQSEVSAFDETVSNILSTRLSDQDTAGFSEVKEAAAAQVSDAGERLSQAKESVEAAQANLSDPHDKEAANQALSLINAQQNMLASGMDIIDEAADACFAYTQAESAWDALMSADSRARDAAALVTNTSVANIKESMSLSNQAISEFNEAKDALLSIEGAYGDDMEGYESYLDLRIEAQQYALESDQAYLDRNKEKASSSNDAYNKADAEAVELVKQLSLEPTELVQQRFDGAVQETKSTYENERSIASNASAILSDYLGSISK